ncbi:hypothetical protein E2562_013410 [Oryza meyeriana var. granulata]|uniref:Uncharacterized protein n=1 Tax=Oryza meyeriana var. granulata TaxID=110450 RepID=A0A6G1ECL4_9ORYZ|nr:hypothetical protein E2562_013410 [Oryza meyeriana var. granulata]
MAADTDARQPHSYIRRSKGDQQSSTMMAMDIQGSSQGQWQWPHMTTSTDVYDSVPSNPWAFSVRICLGCKGGELKRKWRYGKVKGDSWTWCVGLTCGSLIFPAVLKQYSDGMTQLVSVGC